MRVAVKGKSAKKRRRGATLPSGSFEGTGGRPSELTPEIQQKIVGAIMVNGYVETAAAFAGIHKDTFYDWLKRGARASRGKYKEFSDAVGKAMAEAEVRMSMVVAKAANGYDVLEKKTVTGQDRDGNPIHTITESNRHEFDPRAAEWWLERARPQRWGYATPQMRIMATDGNATVGIEIGDPNNTRDFLRSVYETKVLPRLNAPEP